MSGTPVTAEAVRSAEARLLRGGSIEMSAHRPQDAAAIAPLLPEGTAVYVNHLPRHSLMDTLAGVIAVRRAGLEPVPHIAARRVESRADLAAFLRAAVQEAGVRRLLLLGGDLETSSGPFADAAALLSEGVIGTPGIADVAFAAYPDGHPRIAPAVLAAALEQKLDIARSHGLPARVITQFSFAPDRIVALARDLRLRHPHVPVHVGLAGPANPASLLRFARICGVAASLRTLAATGLSTLRLAANVDPGADVSAVARLVAEGDLPNVAGVHLYSFGGTMAAATWLGAAMPPA